MHKRILLAEESDTVRGVAESALRQNGFEVISVVSGEKALEVLELSRPDLIIVGSKLTGKGRKPVYEHVQESERVGNVPLLLLADPEEAGLPFPQEVIISRPVEPKEFIEKVNAFVGRSVSTRPQAAGSNPLTDVTLEDELLDAALGLDQIDVTESEIMDKTQAPSKKKHKVSAQSGQYDGDDENTESGKVESLLIRDEHAEIAHKDPQARKEDTMSSSGKLEILNDQYGLIDEKAANLDSEDRAHDYNWFVNEMQKDTSGFKAAKPGSGTPDAAASSDVLSFSEPSSMVDPVTPPPGKKSSGQQEQDGGVDKFIDEFKKEVEKMHSDEPESITIADGDKGAKGDGSLGWQDTLEKMTPEQLGIFTREFVSELADKIAKMIASKIDEEKLLNLLKREIIQRLEKKR